ncbi:MAG: hypothetical protein KTR31_20580 [Myxococcales bacterium]|nr:hypothetical protein [Myxococcales bacterium]
MPWPELVRRLLVHARGLGCSVEEAEDLVQEALGVLVARPDWYDPARGTLLAALKGIVHHRWVNLRRASSVQRAAAPRLQLVADPVPSPAGPVAQQEAQALRRRFLALLAEDERAVFRAWTQQRARVVDARGAARGLGLQVAAYEAAKKRLRRRCAAILDELGVDATDLFGPREAP